MALFDDYLSEASFDELLDSNKHIRPHWQAILEKIESAGIATIQEKQAEIKWYLEDNGVTYNVYNDPEGRSNRPWSLDPIPFVLQETEWKEIVQGLQQRAKLLDLILKDIYTDQRLIKENIIPAEVIYGHKGFSAEVFEQEAKKDFHLYFYATDMARGPDGKMWVLNDRTQAPSGLGYALENRLTMNAVSQEIFEGIETKKLFDFFKRMKHLIAQLTGTDGIAALLTPGPHNETYFEHAYLSSFLEINLVQGNDLLTKNGCLWLKSLSGLKKINTLLRRVDDRFCDPLELRHDSHLGVAGLLDVARQENIHIINPIGSAILENIGLNPFMEKIAEFFLNEPLILPQIATWWCGQKKELAYVLEHLDTLIVKKIDRTDSIQTYFGKNLTQEERDILCKKLIQNPHQYVAQEEISFSTTPYYHDGKIEPRNAVIRTFCLKTDKGYETMNGGLVRVSSTKDALLVSSQKGGTSKDLWILGKDDTYASLSALKGMVTLDTSINHIPTLRAENLYWLGRYLSRAIVTSRLIRYIIKKMTNFYRYEGMISKEAQELLHIALTHLTMTYPGFLGKEGKLPEGFDPLNEINSVIKDTAKQGSLSFTLSMIANTTINLKHLLTIESSKLFNKMHKEWHFFTKQTNTPNHIIANEMNNLLIYLMAYKELVEESMFKEQGQLIYDIGYKIESALLLISKAQSLLCLKLDKSVGYDVLEAVLNSNESFNAYRAHYKSSLQLENVIEFLIFNPQFPKSLTYMANELLQEFKSLPKAKTYLTSYEEPIFKAYSLLRLSNVKHILRHKEEDRVYLEFNTLLATLSHYFMSCSDELSKTYFSHYDE